MIKPLHRVTCSFDIVEKENPHEVYSGWRIKQPVVDWLLSHTNPDHVKNADYITWALNEPKEQVFITFVDAELAMMFKLTWGGRV